MSLSLFRLISLLLDRLVLFTDGQWLQLVLRQVEVMVPVDSMRVLLGNVGKRILSLVHRLNEVVREELLVE